jgi:hypothetical protein
MSSGRPWSRRIQCNLGYARKLHRDSIDAQRRVFRVDQFFLRVFAKLLSWRVLGDSLPDVTIDTDRDLNIHLHFVLESFELRVFPSGMLDCLSDSARLLQSELGVAS